MRLHRFTNGLPAVYLETMQRLLRDEFAAFLEVYSALATAGLRANTLKISPYDLAQLLPYDLNPIPWCSAGFHLRAGIDREPTSPGRHPYHAAGLYYLQEPSAMAVCELLDPQPGERVLDLCAAPGGKSTHLSARMDDEGLLIANEMNTRRAWELAENLERWGAHNVIILNEKPARLAEHLAGFFDRVLVDAPCSGEGMFRKSEAALRDWSPELVKSCAIRQSAILEDAARLTRPGGVLMYSTCTFNPQENEQTVSGFLTRHTDFELERTTDHPGLSPGRPEWTGEVISLPLERAIRHWPHLAVGEGHFIAMMRRKTSEPVRTRPQKHAKIQRRDRMTHQHATEAKEAFAEFLQAHLHPEALSDYPEERMSLAGDHLYLAPPEAPNLESLRAIRSGWWLGSLRSGEKGPGYRFEPSHALALGLQMNDARLKLNLEAGSEQTQAYLRGEVLDWTGGNGWVVVGVDGFPLGWGRGVLGRLKNHYPRGLRWA